MINYPILTIAFPDSEKKKCCVYFALSDPVLFFGLHSVYPSLVRYQLPHDSLTVIMNGRNPNPQKTRGRNFGSTLKTSGVIMPLFSNLKVQIYSVMSVRLF